MAEIIRVIADWIMLFLQSVGLWGVFLALAIESACIPITSEAFLLFAGFLVAQGVFDLPTVVAAGVAGFTVGAFLPYYLGRRHGARILGAGGRFFFASEHELNKVEAWFERHGYRAVLLGRLVPVVRDFVSLPAGHARMPLGQFILYTALGSFPWIFAATLLGRYLESEWPTLLSLIERGNRLILIVILSLLALLVVRSFWLRRKPAG